MNIKNGLLLIRSRLLISKREYLAKYHEGRNLEIVKTEYKTLKGVAISEGLIDVEIQKPQKRKRKKHSTWGRIMLAGAFESNRRKH